MDLSPGTIEADQAAKADVPAMAGSHMGTYSIGRQVSGEFPIRF